MQVPLGSRAKGTCMDSNSSLLVTLDEAARLLSCSRRTIRRLVLKGVLEEVRLTSDTPRLRKRDVIKLAGLQGPPEGQG